MESYITYQSLQVAMRSADLSFWSMISGWIAAVVAMLSLIVSAVTLYFASRALSTWREQEQTKAKIDFKKSLLSVRNALSYMPKKWSESDLRRANQIMLSSQYMHLFHQAILDLPEQHKRFLDSNDHANDCWVICEHLFDGTPIEKKWRAILGKKNDYLKGNIEKTELFDALNELYSERFVFEFK